MVEERCTEALAGLWPINANRNRALMLAATPAVLLLDVDFLVGGSLSPWLRGPSSADGSGGLADARRRLRASSRAMLDGIRGGSGSSVSGASSNSRKSSSSSSRTAGGSKGGKHEWPSVLKLSAGSKNTSADDAWLAALLAQAEAQQVGWLEAVLSQNAAVVLPAFQTATTRRQLLRGRRIALAAAAAGKEGLAAMATATPPQIFGFQQDKYPRGHKATRYWWWLQSNRPYAIDYWQVRPCSGPAARAWWSVAWAGAVCSTTCMPLLLSAARVSLSASRRVAHFSLPAPAFHLCRASSHSC